MLLNTAFVLKGMYFLDIVPKFFSTEKCIYLLKLNSHFFCSLKLLSTPPLSTLWQSSFVREIFDSKTFSTSSGTRYNLIGPLHFPKYHTHTDSLTLHLNRKFARDGLIPNWKVGQKKK